ncbi:MAG: pyridoxal-phosphate dependent enzyme [Saprospiraceae bacterium]|nr:pyridoxal-phosphate dependent enzyme [Saprospiraceae bacterium]
MSNLLKYRDLLNGVSDVELLSMGEGTTPLVKSRRIGFSLGLSNLYFKLESLNPTGSYKDRFGALAISGLLATNAKFCLATSSGNTGASLAAYSALAGIPCHIVVVDGAPAGKLKQMQAYGAHLWMLRDFGIDESVTQRAFEGLQRMAIDFKTSVQISAFAYSPFGMQGVRSIAYEIAEEQPGVQHVFVPAGGGGLTLAVVQGFKQWSDQNSNFQMPQVHCVQPEGNDTIASSLRNGAPRCQAIPVSTTSISGLQVPSVIDGDQVLKTCSLHGGNGYVVTDHDVLELQRQLALSEGIFCEPAAAVALAGAHKALQNAEIKNDDLVVCLVTGHGFKDPKATEKIIEGNPLKHIVKLEELKSNLNESN